MPLFVTCSSKPSLSNLLNEGYPLALCTGGTAHNGSNKHIYFTPSSGTTVYDFNCDNLEINGSGGDSNDTTINVSNGGSFSTLKTITNDDHKITKIAHTLTIGKETSVTISGPTATNYSFTSSNNAISVLNGISPTGTNGHQLTLTSKTLSLPNTAFENSTYALYVGSNASSDNNHSELSNGNVYVNLHGSNPTSNYPVLVNGASGIKVTSPQNARTVNIAHTNSITAGTAGSSSNESLTFGGTFNIPYINYDAQGHITSTGNRTITMASETHAANHTFNVEQVNTTFAKISLLNTNSSGRGEASFIVADWGGITLSCPTDNTLEIHSITSYLYVGTNTADSDYHEALSNGSVYINLNNDLSNGVDNYPVLFNGASGIKVTSPQNARTVNIAHTNSITAGNVGPTSFNTTLYTNEFTVPYIKYDSQGHITSTQNYTISVPITSSIESGLFVGANNATTNESKTNGNVYLNLHESDGNNYSHKITGSGSTSVTSDSSGNIIISSTASSVSVVDNNPTLSWSNTSTIGTVDGSSLRVTMPANPNTDTSVTSANNHYTPITSTTLSASGGTNTNITGTTGQLNIVTGLGIDSKGHITSITSANIYSTDTNTKVTSASNHYDVTDSNVNGNANKTYVGLTKQLNFDTKGHLISYSGTSYFIKDIRYMTQSQYNSATKDANTLYLIY